MLAFSRSPAGSADIALESMIAQYGAWRVLRSALWSLAAGGTSRPAQGLPAQLRKDVGLLPSEPPPPYRAWRS